MAFYIYAADGSGIAAFDLLESETHTEVCQATEHNVEDGSPVTDHVRIDSSQLSFSLGVTNTPIGTDPDKGRGRVAPIELFTPTFRPPFDGTPGAIFRGLSSVGSAVAPQSTFVDVMQYVPSFDRIGETEQLLLDIKNGAKLCTVITATRTYDDVILERVELTKSKPGLGMFSIDIKQIRFVKTAAVQAPKPLEPRGAPAVKAGQQSAPTTPSGDAADRKSVLITLLQKLGVTT
jgi:hypothetical protein